MIRLNKEIKYNDNIDIDDFLNYVIREGKFNSGGYYERVESKIENIVVDRNSKLVVNKPGIPIYQLNLYTFKNKEPKRELPKLIDQLKKDHSKKEKIKIEIQQVINKKFKTELKKANKLYLNATDINEATKLEFMYDWYDDVELTSDRFQKLIFEIDDNGDNLLSINNGSFYNKNYIRKLENVLKENVSFEFKRDYLFNLLDNNYIYSKLMYKQIFPILNEEYDNKIAFDLLNKLNEYSSDNISNKMSYNVFFQLMSYIYNDKYYPLWRSIIYKHRNWSDFECFIMEKEFRNNNSFYAVDDHSDKMYKIISGIDSNKNNKKNKKRKSLK